MKKFYLDHNGLIGGKLEVITDNKKIVKVIYYLSFENDQRDYDNNQWWYNYYINKKIVGLAKCNLDAGDKFNFNFGLQVALTKIQNKLEKYKEKILNNIYKDFDKSYDYIDFYKFRYRNTHSKE